MLRPIKLANKNFLSSLDTSSEEVLHILEIAKNFKNSHVCILQNLRHMALVEDYKKVFVKIEKFLVSLNLH